jgi:hypothetical protein
MKANIWADFGNQVGISCDGENVEVLGDSNIARSIEGFIANPDSGYNQKRREMGASFDPATYWEQSSMNLTSDFFDSYSTDNLEVAKRVLTGGSADE